MRKFASFLIKYRRIIMPIMSFCIIVILLSSFIMMLTLEDGTFDENKKGNVPASASKYTTSAKVSNKGIKLEKTPKEHWDEIIAEKGNIKDYLDNEEELEKLMNAEIRSQYPKIEGAETELNGIVEFERHKENGQTVKLKFMELADFQSRIKNNNPDVENYYTLDESNNLLLGVVREITETVTSNDPEMQISGQGVTYEVNTKVINYKELIRKYSLPFQYLWSLIVVGDDKDFALELVDLIDGSQIIVGIYDNINTTRKETTTTYARQKKLDVTAEATCYTNYGNFIDMDSWEIEEELQETSYEVKKVVEIKENIPIIDVSKADVWVVDYSKEYEHQSASVVSNEVNEKDLEDEFHSSEPTIVSEKGDGSDLEYYDKFEDLLIEFKKDFKKEILETVQEEEEENGATKKLAVEKTEITYCETTIYYKDVNRHQKDEDTVYAQKYVTKFVINNPKVQKKTEEEIKNGTGQDNFVSILCEPEHSSARSKITYEVTSWLLELLESNPDTKNMIDLTKYLIYAVTEDDVYGSADYDFSEFETNGFTDVGGTIKGGSIQEKVWNALKALGYSDIAVSGAMGNIHYESGSFNPSAVEGGYTEDTGGIGICQWTNNHRGKTGRNAELRAFATSRGLAWQDEDIQVEFLIGELTKGGGADGYASYQLADTTELYRSHLACASAWIDAETTENATKAFCYSFERPKKEAAASSMPMRISYANQYYAMYAGK